MAQDFQVTNNVTEKLARNEVVLSMTVRQMHDVGIGLIAKSAGFDTIYVDLEHSSFSLGDAAEICVTAQLAGVTPFVRVPALEPEYVSRLLDIGAMGIIAPHVNSVDDAKRVVQYAKYPPIGKRSASGRFPATFYVRKPVKEIYETMNRATTVLAMIESKGGLESVEAIAAVEGVDILHIGANDLSNELGLIGQIDHPALEAAIMRIIAAAKRYGKHIGIGGILGPQPAMAARLVAAGVRYISTTTDLELLCNAATERVQSARKILCI